MNLGAIVLKRLNSTHVWMLAVTFVLVSLTAAVGQIDGMSPYGNRVEGTRVHLDALPHDLSVFAVHRSFDDFHSHSKLMVRFFLPQLKTGPNTTVSVEAVEREDLFHYFMQSASNIRWKENEWNTFGPWPTKDVLDPLGLNSGNIAVVAYYKANNGRSVFLPVDVFDDTSPNPTKATGHIYTFFYTTGKPIQSLALSVTDAVGKSVNLHGPHIACNTTLNPDCVLATAGSTASFDLNMFALPEGEYQLKLVGNVVRDPELPRVHPSPVAQEIVFYHHP